MSYRPHRYPTVFPIDLKIGTDMQRCHLTNITSTGAGLFDVTGLAKGDLVTVSSSVGSFAATVQWADDDQCGVAFQQRLSVRQLEQFRHSPTTTGHNHRPIHTFTELR